MRGTFLIHSHTAVYVQVAPKHGTTKGGNANQIAITARDSGDSLLRARAVRGVG